MWKNIAWVGKMWHVFFQGLAEVDYAQRAEFCRQGGNVAHEVLHFKVKRISAHYASRGKVPWLPAQGNSAARAYHFDIPVSSVEGIAQGPVANRILFIQIAAEGLQRVSQVYHSLRGEIPGFRP